MTATLPLSFAVFRRIAQMFPCPYAACIRRLRSIAGFSRLEMVKDFPRADSIFRMRWSVAGFPELCNTWPTTACLPATWRQLHIRPLNGFSTFNMDKLGKIRQLR